MEKMSSLLDIGIIGDAPPALFFFRCPIFFCEMHNSRLTQKIQEKRNDMCVSWQCDEYGKRYLSCGMIFIFCLACASKKGHLGVKDHVYATSLAFGRAKCKNGPCKKMWFLAGGWNLCECVCVCSMYSLCIHHIVEDSHMFAKSHFMDSSPMLGDKFGSRKVCLTGYDYYPSYR